MVSIKQSFSNLVMVIKESAVVLWHNPQIIATVIVLNLILRTLFVPNTFSYMEIAHTPYTGVISWWIAVFGVVCLSLLYWYFSLSVTVYIMHILRQQTASWSSSFSTALQLTKRNIGVVLLFLFSIFITILGYVFTDTLRGATLFIALSILGIMALVIDCWLVYAEQLLIDGQNSIKAVAAQSWQYVKKDWVALLGIAAFYLLVVFNATLILVPMLMIIKFLSGSFSKEAFMLLSQRVNILLFSPIFDTWLLVMLSRLYLQLRQKNK